MDIEPTITFTSNVAIPVLLGTLGTLGAAAGFAAILVPKIAERILPKPRESKLSDFLPFEELEMDGKTVKCKGDIICKFVGIMGVDQAFLPPEEARTLAEARKSVYDQLAETGTIIRSFLIREPISIDTKAVYPNEAAALIAETWHRNFDRSFRTYNVLCVSRKGSTKVDRQKLDDAVATVESILSPYRPKVLDQNPINSPTMDVTIGSFLGRLVSPISRPSPRLFGKNFSDVLAADEVHFLKNGRIRFRSGNDEKYASVIGIKRFGDDVSTMMANQLASIPFESVIFQSIAPLPKTETLLKLKQQQKMIQSTSFSRGVWEEFQQVIDMVDGLTDNKQCLCLFSETIFLFAKDEKELDLAEREARQIINAHGATPATEKGASQASWFHQFPSYEERPREYRLTSSNAAMLATFERPHVGLIKSDWGKGPIALFNTASNTVYSFQFHATPEPAAVGHGLCIAPTGAGKTVLMEFLSCMASRHKNLKHYFFDRYQGTYIYTTAMEGKYLGFNASPATLSIRGGMNPFQCENTDENRDFITNWLAALANVEQEDSASLGEIGMAIDTAFSDLDEEDRSLDAIYDVAFKPNSYVKKQLAKWVGNGQYAAMFNAVKDSIDLDNSWLTTFDMSNLFDDPILAGASVNYIAHRIRQSMKRQNAPGFIFIDETEPLLRNPEFKKLYLVMLQEFRKLRGAVISVFQRPEALKASGISELVRGQCSTYYLFPNPGSQEKDYNEFDLTDSEMAFVTGHFQTHGRRMLLLKRPGIRESVILDIDLKPLGPMIKIFSSTVTDVKAVSDLQKNYPEEWLRRWLLGEID